MGLSKSSNSSDEVHCRVWCLSQVKVAIRPPPPFEIARGFSLRINTGNGAL